jgi:hypothetical protein
VPAELINRLGGGGNGVAWRWHGRTALRRDPPRRAVSPSPPARSMPQLTNQRFVGPSSSALFIARRYLRTISRMVRSAARSPQESRPVQSYPTPRLLSIVSTIDRQE